MPGQGCPSPRFRSPSSRFSTRGALLLMSFLGLYGGTAFRVQAEPVGTFSHPTFSNGIHGSNLNLHFRITWGGGEPRKWRAIITLSEGKVLRFQNLGMDPDEPGSVWIQQGAGGLPRDSLWEGLIGANSSMVVVRPPSPRTYQGLDVLVEGPPDASLLLVFWTDDPPQKRRWVTIPLNEISHRELTVDLDESGNRLFVHRREDDTLRVDPERQVLLFSPEETIKFNIYLNMPGGVTDQRLRLQARLVRSRENTELWTTEIDWQPTAQPRVPLELSAPKEQGVYELKVSISSSPRLPLPNLVSLPGWGSIRSLPELPEPAWSKPKIAERTIQLTVVRPDRPPMMVSSASWRQVGQIEPGSTKWWEKLPGISQPIRLLHLLRPPFGSGQSRLVQLQKVPWTELEASAGSSEPSWEAYTLPVDKVGKPHIVEVEVTNTSPQSVAICILEANGGGGVYPFGLDSGITITSESTRFRLPGESVWHRLVFWPRTKEPILLVSNLHSIHPARLGRIRVLAGPDHLTPADATPPEAGSRLFAAYFHRPLFPELFGATQVPLGKSRMGADDWHTFYEGGRRLIEYLAYAGYGGVMLTVLAEGSTIYPSQLLEPTPRHESGALIEAGLDPIRKDVLELLFRLFDRENLKLIPALEFATPLPELERIIREDPFQLDYLRLIDETGCPLVEKARSSGGLGPYYNILEPRVQAAVEAVIVELVSRYGHHPSFGGIAVHLSPSNFTQFPKPLCPLDDLTVARFQRETGLVLPGSGPERFAARAQWLRESGMEKWLAWRAQLLAGFYRRLSYHVTQANPQARLYLAGYDIFGSPDLREILRPRLPHRSSIGEALLGAGFDLRLYEDAQQIVFLRPHRYEANLDSREVPSPEIAHNTDWERLSESRVYSGVLNFQSPSHFRLDSFAEQCPIQPCYFWASAQLVPAGFYNRKRIAEALAYSDALWVFDGGPMLTVGQEESIQRYCRVYRRLPTVRFNRVTDSLGQDPVQPLVVRYAAVQEYAYIYAVNLSPISLAAVIQLVGPEDAVALDLASGRTIELASQGGMFQWTINIDAYDVAAIKVRGPETRIISAQIRWNESEYEVLAKEIVALSQRLAVLRNPPLWTALQNPSFELSPQEGEAVPGWFLLTPGAKIQLDSQISRQGKQSLRLLSEDGTATLVTHPFPPPETGRLAVRAFIRASAPISPVRLVIEGKKHEGEVLTLGEVLNSRLANQPSMVSSDWQPFGDLEIPNLPADQLSVIRLRIDLMGPGELWLDDVQLCQLSFSRTELIELIKLLAPAEASLAQGRIGTCLRVLDSYWARFLQAYVEVSEPIIASTAGLGTTKNAGPHHQPTPKSSDGGGWFRLRDWLPKRLRFF